MLTWRNGVDNSVPESEVESTLVVSWQGCNSLDFEGASIMLRHVYGETVDNVAAFAAASSVSALVVDKDDRNLDNIPLSRIDDVHTRLCVDFKAI